VFAQAAPVVVDAIHRSEQLRTHGPTQLFSLIQITLAQLLQTQLRNIIHFPGNSYDGPIDNGNGITIQNSLSIDSPIGVEDDACASSWTATNIVVKNNMLQVLQPRCW
jgi:hypothetical protein